MDSMGIIGVAKKCCWCCSTLAMALCNLDHSSISFQIPVSHSLIFPWALPAIGISVPVVKFMETTVMSMWLKEAVKFGEIFPGHPKKVIQSAMSLPPGSIPSGESDEFLSDETTTT